MINDYARHVYLKLLTSKGTLIVSLISNVTSYARVTDPVILNENTVEFIYQAIDRLTHQPNGQSKKMTKKFDFRIFEIKDLIYGQMKILVRVNVPRGEQKVIPLIGNSTSPAGVDFVKLIGDDTIEFKYLDFKASSERTIKKKVNFQILSIAEMLYGDLPSSPSITQELKQSFLDLVDLLQKHNQENQKQFLTYWLYGGTMLSTLRSRGIDKEDDNCNLGVLYEDVWRLNEIISATYRFFLADSSGFFMVKRNPFGTISVYDYQLNQVVAQIYYFKKSPNVPPFWQPKLKTLGLENQSFYWCNAGDKSSVWPTIHGGIFNLPESYLFPLKPEFFYNRHLNLPNKCSEYCKLIYGPNCLSHRNQDKTKKFILDQGYQEIPIEDFSPL